MKRAIFCTAGDACPGHLDELTIDKRTPAPHGHVRKDLHFRVQMRVLQQKWDGRRERLMRVLLDEHKIILNSYQAQKYGGGEGSTGEVMLG